MMNFDENSQKIIIPEGTVEILDEQFKNYPNLEEVIIPDSVVRIGREAFRGCKNLKRVKLSKRLKLLESFAFAECCSLEEVELPPSLGYIDRGVFAACSKLRKINLHDKIHYIDDFAFSQCHNLCDFQLPKELQSVGIKAFFGCAGVEELFIPKTLENIEIGAFSLMPRLRKITVDPENPKYISDEGVALIQREQGFLLQYAIASPEDEFAVGYYEDLIDENFSTSSLVYNISDYAFAGAKNLKKLYLPSEIESVGGKTFLNCDKLKDLHIFFTPYGTTLLLNVFGQGDSCTLPFQKITIDEGVSTITDNMAPIFQNATSIQLPKTLKHIGRHDFTLSTNLKKLDLPKGLQMIMPDTFPDSLLLHFPEVGTIQAKDFNMLETKTSDEYVNNLTNKDNVRIFSLKDGSYYVTIDDYDTVRVNRDEIDALSSSSYLLRDDPDIFIEYLVDLLSINVDSDNISFHILTDAELEKKFQDFIRDLEYVRSIANSKNERAIRDTLERNGIVDDALFNGILMRNISKKDLLLIVENMTPSLQRFFRYSNFFDPEKYQENKEAITDIFDHIPETIGFCNLLEQYQVFDRFLYHPKFFANLSIERQEMLIKNYNAHIKRALSHSGALEGNDHLDYNLSDLMKFLQVMGAFSGDEKLSQRVCNFMTEKIFSEFDSTGKENPYRIIGDDLHRVFGEFEVREQLDLEFILFFIENYKDLIYLEKTTSGFIARIYNSFPEISRCSTADSGEQRHKKVTIEKCKSFFLMQNDITISDEDQDLAIFLGKYYTITDEFLKKAKAILLEASHAPRNIFTKTFTDEQGNIIYDNDPNLDLKGEVDIGFSYEWLPKQSYDNLILGKYCNCCAHLNGAGAGIMRASMVSDCCQNLVIRDGQGNIIAKMTLAINKEQGYGVFNTVELNLNNRNQYGIEKVYEAFMKGSEAFLETYNRNHPDAELTCITIGKNRNVLQPYLEESGHQETVPLDTVNYSHYSYELGGRMVGNYDGDATKEQILVLKKRHSNG